LVERRLSIGARCHCRRYRPGCPGYGAELRAYFVEVQPSRAYVEVERMYGTIMRAKVKAGRRAEYERVMREMVPSAEAYGQGMHSYEVAWEEKDPDRIVLIVHFKDRESYMANASRVETNTDYNRQLEYLDGEPEWIDVNYADYVGKPLGG
jgi:quinol monooxygenase YgiN